jgi:hypothetical protein
MPNDLVDKAAAWVDALFDKEDVPSLVPEAAVFRLASVLDADTAWFTDWTSEADDPAATTVSGEIIAIGAGLVVRVSWKQYLVDAEDGAGCVALVQAARDVSTVVVGGGGDLMSRDAKGPGCSPCSSGAAPTSRFRSRMTE